MRKKSVLYLEIADTIKNDIQNNIYPVGTMLPTENEFEDLFKVSKITVRKAIEVLSLQGYVEKKSGKGTTVISNRLFNTLSKGDSFSTILEKRGLRIEKQIIAVEKVKLDKEHKYYPYFGKSMTHVTRVYYANDNPYILFHHFLPGKVFNTTASKLHDTSMYRILADNNFLVDRFKDEFTVSILGAEEKRQLKTEESHVMKRVRTAFDSESTVIEISVSLYNTSLHPYEIDFEI